MPSTPETWVVVGECAALESIAPLVAAHKKQRPVRVLDRGQRRGVPTQLSALGGLDALVPPAGYAELRDAAGLLVLGDRRRSPRHGLPGLFVHDDTGRRVPVGWLPNLPTRLPTFASAAAKVVTRVGRSLPRGPMVLLGQWDDRTLTLATQTESAFAGVEHPVPLFRWTSERIVQMDLIRALQCGPGLAVYFGHGRPRGWAGYHGVRGHHFEGWSGDPLGAVLSLTCHTANRWMVPTSFAEDLVLNGVCAASMGAVRKTVHLENGLLANILCSTLTSSAVTTLGEWLVASSLTDPQAFGSYRLLGDPLAPLVGAPESCERAGAVYAPAPDATLVPLEAEIPNPA